MLLPNASMLHNIGWVSTNHMSYEQIFSCNFQCHSDKRQRPKVSAFNESRGNEFVKGN